MVCKRQKRLNFSTKYDFEAAEAPQTLIPNRNNCCSFWWMNVYAAMLHLVWFSSCVALFYSNGQRDLQYPLYQSYSTWAFGPAPSHVENNTCVRPKGIGFGPMTVFPTAVDSGIVLRLHWLMSSFFALSFVFQIAASMLDYCGVYPYEENVRKYGTHWMRFVEYSFSASVMIAGIGLQLGIMDLWMHVALFALTWICMMCGLVAEQLMGLEIEIGKANTPVGLDFMRWVTHLMGWIPQIVIYGILVSYFYRSQKTCDFDGNDRNVAPEFVYWIIFMEMALFGGFGITQIVQFVLHEFGRYNHEGIEIAYIIQSMISKFTLGFLIYGGNFAEWFGNN